MRPKESGTALLSRREAMARVAGAGLAIASALRMSGQFDLAAAEPAAELQRGAAQALKYPPIPSWPTEMRQLAPNVYGYTQAGGQGVPSSAISNGACIIGPNGWMAIDAFAAPPHTKAFLAAAAKVTGGKPCTRLVDTHHHADHTTGNCFFLPAEIVGSAYCRDAVIKGGISNLNGRPESWKVGAEELKLAPPVTTFDDKSHVTYYYGNTEVQLIHTPQPAHTWGDVMVYLPQHKILWAGDVAFHYVAPASQSGWITKWIETLDQILKMDVDVIVPGHGAIGGKKEIAELREYLDLVKRESKKRYDAKMTPGKAAADIDMGKFENWADPAANRLVTHVLRLYAEFNGTLTPEGTPGGAEATAEYNKIKGITPPGRG